MCCIVCVFVVVGVNFSIALPTNSDNSKCSVALTAIFCANKWVAHAFCSSWNAGKGVELRMISAKAITQLLLFSLCTGGEEVERLRERRII